MCGPVTQPQNARGGHIDGIWQKVDREGFPDPELGSPLMAPDPAGLVELYRFASVTRDSTVAALSPFGPRTSASCANIDRFSMSTIGW